jgi:hypothetical protein
MATHTCGACGEQFPLAQLQPFIAHLNTCMAQAPPPPQPQMPVFQQPTHIAANAGLRNHQRSTHASLEQLYTKRLISSVLVCACTGRESLPMVLCMHIFYERLICGARRHACRERQDWDDCDGSLCRA